MKNNINPFVTPKPKQFQLNKTLSTSTIFDDKFFCKKHYYLNLT